MLRQLMRKGSFLILMCFVISLTIFQVESRAQDFEMPERPQQADFSEEEITAFARAQSKIVELQQNYNQRFAQAESEAEQQSLMQEANQEMIGVIESVGLTIDVFNAIAAEVQDNPALMRRIHQSMQDM